MSKRPVLGKGLDALLDEGIDDSLPDKRSGHEEVLYLPLDLLVPNSDQPRQKFDDESILELAASIREQGVIQPILAEARNDGTYMLIAGERRLRASKHAGLSKVPVLVRKISPEKKLEMALVENIQREDLTPMEEARAYFHLMDVLKLSQQEVADKVGKNRSSVANSLRLLKLPESMRKAVEERKISAGHARALLAVNNPADQMLLLKKILDNSLSVRDAEACAADMNQGKKKPDKLSHPKDMHEKDPELSNLEEQFIQAFGTKVSLKGTLAKGRMEISWYSPEGLEGIYERIIGESEL